MNKIIYEKFLGTKAVPIIVESGWVQFSHYQCSFYCSVTWRQFVDTFLYKYRHFRFNVIPSKVAKPFIDRSPDLLLSKIHSGNDYERRNGNKETDKKRFDYNCEKNTDSINVKSLVEDSNKKDDNYSFKNKVTTPRKIITSCKMCCSAIQRFILFLWRYKLLLNTILTRITLTEQQRNKWLKIFCHNSPRWLKLS